jgi:hypothetical protein
MLFIHENNRPARFAGSLQDAILIVTQGKCCWIAKIPAFFTKIIQHVDHQDRRLSRVHLQWPAEESSF